MTYVAMLRGINVGGTKPVKMDRLREVFQELGLEDVRTYVQSGNVVFRSKAGSASALGGRIEAAIRREFGFPVPTLLRSASQLEKIIKNNPFPRESGIDATKLHVTFLADAPSATGLRKLEEVPAKPDRFRISGHEIYLHCPSGYGRTKLSNNVIERLLEVGATTRNWNTLNQLHRMSLERGT